MTAYQYRLLRNYLQTIACTVNICSVEYKNLNRRIKVINDKLWRL